MRELSLNILDIVQNSIKANATLIGITVKADFDCDMLVITITDNGHGMEKEFLERVLDPFTTTRTTRKVGMGLPFFKQSAEMAGGTLKIQSTPGEGTIVTAEFRLSSIDRMPLGDLADTMGVLLLDIGDKDYRLEYSVKCGEEQTFEFDTREVRQIYEGMPLDDYEVASALKDYIKENINAINGGLDL